MANEARLNLSLNIANGTFQYRSHPTAFLATVTGKKGPVPGAITARTTGTAVSFAELTVPRWCRIENLDATNFVTIGIYDGASFFPLLELEPAEFIIVPLSRYLNQEFAGTGTGTSADVNQLMLIADTANCNVKVEAFEK